MSQGKPYDLGMEKIDVSIDTNERCERKTELSSRSRRERAQLPRVCSAKNTHELNLSL